VKRIIVIAVLVLTTIQITAQESRGGKIGIGYNGNFTTQNSDLAMSFWFGDKFTFEPQVGFRYVDIENNSGTNWRIGLGVLFRLNEMIISPYVGLRFKDNLVTNSEKTYSDLVFSGVFGGEYFFSEWFSTGIEMKLNYVKTDDEFSPTYGIAEASIFETEQVLNLRVYLK
jgi:hypothetical protein